MESAVLVRVVAGVGFLLLAAGAGWWTTRLPDACRQYGFAIAAAIGVLGLTFAFEGVYMHTRGIETVLGNLGYGVSWLLVALVVCAVAGAGRRLTVALVAVAAGRFWLMLATTYGMFYLGEAIGGLLMLVALVGSLVAWTALLQRPLSRVGNTKIRTRRLLFTKLKYFGILAWVAHTASIAMFGAQVMIGLPGDLTRVYLDVIIMAAITGVTLRSVDALEATAAETSLLSFGSDSESESETVATPEAAD